MSAECYPIAMLPNTTQLYRDYLAMGDSAASSPVRAWYGAEPLGRAWMGASAAGADAGALAGALERQSLSFGASPATLANIAKLRNGARAVVTGQQVGLLGGPLLTLLKAATAIARAKQATAATGVEHVPIFWTATEDHDLEEVDQVSLLTKTAVETLRLGAKFPHHDVPVGGVVLEGHIDGLLEQAANLLGHAPICDLLRECYGYQPANSDGATFGSAFARLMTRLFAEQGLIVMDAAGRDFHPLGAPALRYAIEHAEELEAALLARAVELEAAGLPRAGAGQAGRVAAVSPQPGRRQPGRQQPRGLAPLARRNLENRQRRRGRAGEFGQVVHHRGSAGYSRRVAGAAEPERNSAPGLPGQHSAYRCLCRRPG